MDLLRYARNVITCSDFLSNSPPPVLESMNQKLPLLKYQQFPNVLCIIKGLSSRRRRREGMQRVQTAKSNMLLNLNLRDVLLRGPQRAHHDNRPSCCARRLARALDTPALASSRMHWKRDDRSTELGLDSPTCSLLSNNLRAVVDSGERVWFILLYLRAIFVATPTGEVSEVEIVLRFDGVPEPALSSVFARTCSQLSVFFRVHPLSVRGPTFTCMRGSVIFSNMLDFAVYEWTACVACPLAAFGGSISPWYNNMAILA